MINRRELLARVGLLAPCWLAGELVAAPDQPGMLVHSREPHNAETRLDKLIGSWITPNDLFYIRSHAPIPEIDVREYRLGVEGLVKQPLSLSLAELQSDFVQRSVVATLTCAGNRRSEHSAVQPVDGVQWQAGAIGNASWSGVALADVLRRAGLREGASHVWFEGLDQIQRSGGIIPFGGSIPVEKAMSELGMLPGALVATGMNGQPLPPDHGFPVRTVVPGYIGARSVKWLGKIVVSDRPSPNHYVATAYKLVQESTAENWAAAPILYDYPLNSVTCRPIPGARVPSGPRKVAGFALAPALRDGSAGDGTVRRVEVSTDGGRRWMDARFTTPAVPLCWRFWEAELALAPGDIDLVVRATDSAGNAQAEQVPWNLKGYMFNAWHRTRLYVV